MNYLTRIILVLSFGLFLSGCNQESVEQYLERGKQFATNSEWKSAIIEFKNAAKLEPDNAAARAELGKAYVETFSSSAAIKELNKALELGYQKDELIIPLAKSYRQINQSKNILDNIKVEPNQSADLKANVHALRGAAYLNLNQLPEAKQELEKAAALNSSLDEVRLAWAGLEGTNGNVDAQRKWIEPLLGSGSNSADAWSILAVIEHQEQNFAEAEKAYTQSIDLRPFAHIDLIKRAMVRIALENYEGAQADVDKLKAAGANWPIVGHTDGFIAFQKKDLETAQDKFLDVLSKNSDYPPSQYLLGVIYFNNGNYINAQTLLADYLRVVTGQPRASIVYATTLLKLSRVDEALEVLNPLNKQIPDNPQVLSLLGNAYLAKGENRRASQLLEKAIKLEPDSAGSRLQLGTVLLRDKSTFSKGQVELVKAIEIDPDLHRAELALFLSYMQEKEFEKAREFAVTVNENNKDNAQGLNMIAMSYLAEGNNEQAKMELNDALKKFPADPNTSHNLGRMLIRGKDLDGAKKLYEAVVKNDGGNLTALNQLALIAAREGNSEKMLALLKTAQERNPNQLSARLQLANQYLKDNKANDAIQLLNSASDGDKQVTAYVLVMAIAKIAANEPAQAVRRLKALVTKEPLPGAHFLLARAYGLQKKPKEMREALENTLESSPEHLGAGLVISRLDLIEGKYDDFKKRINLLVKSYPENPDVQFLKAKSDSSDKNYTEAIGTLSEILERTPNTNVAIDLSRNQWQSGDRDGALTGLEVWMEANPDDNRAKLELAQLYLANNKNSDAIAAYEDLSEKIPDHHVALNNLAWLLMDIDIDKAIYYGEKALSLKPDSPLIKDTVAMLYLKAGDNQKALNLSGQAASEAPQVFDIQMNYSKVLKANGRAEEASALLRQLQGKVQSDEQKSLIQNELDN